MARTYRHLDLDERRTLFRLVEARPPVGEIAGRLGRHPSTIHRELGRNRFRDGDRGFCGYFPLNAQDLAHGVGSAAASWPPTRRSRARLRQLADRLNDTPRRCLGYRTPREVFQQHLAAPTGPP